MMPINWNPCTHKDSDKTAALDAGACVLCLQEKLDYINTAVNKRDLKRCDKADLARQVEFFRFDYFKHTRLIDALRAENAALRAELQVEIELRTGQAWDFTSLDEMLESEET